MLPETFRFRSADLEEARTVLGRFYYPVAVGAPEGAQRFRLDTEVIQHGPLTVGHLRFAAPATLGAPDLDSYHVTIATTGRIFTRQGDRQVISAPATTAAVFCPGAAVHTLHEADASEVNVKVTRQALEAELSAMLGRSVHRRIDFAPSLHLADGAGRTWTRLVDLLRDRRDHLPSLLHQPLIAERLRHTVLAGLLLSVPHRDLDELTAPSRPGPPRAIRRTMDAVQGEPERAFTVGDLAAIAGISVRSLQEGFRRHVGMAPMSYLQQVRLSRAHQTLCEEDPWRVTVAQVAHQWGFAHLGRFASAYRRRYGNQPSETLRKRR